MLMAKQAWKSVKPETIKNCWDHTGIQRDPLPPIVIRTNPSSKPTTTPETLSLGWDIIVQYVSEEWSLPDVHRRLMEWLGDRYVASDWDKPLDVVLREEDDVDAALASLDALKHKLGVSPATSPKIATTDECTELEGNIRELMKDLRVRNRIFGSPLTIEDILDPAEERNVGNVVQSSKDVDAEIVARVRKEFSGEDNDAIELDSDSDDGIEEPTLSLKEMVALCRTLERASIDVGGERGLEVAKVMRSYGVDLQALITTRAVQTTLDKYFKT
jgi:hypothetical protein